MTRDEHKKAIQSLLGMVSADHQASASELLTNLSDDYEKTLTDFEQAQADVQNLTNNNETLRQVNAKLFLRVGETEHKQEKTNEHEVKSEEEKIPQFSELFNEKGELI